MTIFDKNLINDISELDSLTDKILLCLNENDENNSNVAKEIEGLYKKRKPVLENIQKYYDNNTDLIKKNNSDWENLVVPIREKDEEALKLLGGKVKELQNKLIKRHKQKSLLIYEKEKQK